MSLLSVIVASFIIFQSCGGNADNLSVGNSAPGFTLEDSEGNTYSLLDYKGKNPVIIYFYPKANTPGCTKQACGIRDSFSKFKENDIIIFGISVDSKTSIKEFIKDYNLNFPLLSDEKKEVSKAYGVLNTIGLDSRITFIIDKQGKIANILKDVDVETHADEVFNLAVKLK
ncbi:MAG: peroxiredoxin [Ignavibacterium sp.]|nr:peroxiredoxin [Ignavibacterium sp.]